MPSHAALSLATSRHSRYDDIRKLHPFHPDKKEKGKWRLMAHLALSHSGKAMNDKMNSRMVKPFMLIGLVWLLKALHFLGLKVEWLNKMVIPLLERRSRFVCS